MKRLFLLAPALLVLAACESAPASPPPTVPEHVLESSTATPPPSSPADVVDEVMRSVAADEGITMPAGMGGDYADIVCTGFEDGLAFPLIVQIAADALPDWTVEQHAFLVGASVGSACPEYAHTIAGGAA